MVGFIGAKTHTTVSLALPVIARRFGVVGGMMVQFA